MIKIKELIHLINILEDHLRRKVQLIDFLSYSDLNISVEFLSEQLDVSKSTIQRDIESLNSDYSSLIVIKNELNSVFLSNPNSEQLYYLKNLLLNSSSNIKLLTELLVSPFQKVKELSQHLNTSSSNIYKTIKRINLSLSPYQIEIVNVSNKYFIEASAEITLRKLFSVYWSELHAFDTHYHDNYQELTQIKAKLSNSVYDTIQLTQPYFIAFIYISLLREEQQFPIMFEENQRKCQVSTPESREKIILKSINYLPLLENPLFNTRQLNSLKSYFEDSLNNKDSVEILFQFISFIYHNELSDQIPLTLFSSKYIQFYSSLKKQSHLYYAVKEVISDIANILRTNLDDYEVIISYILVIYFPDILQKADKKTVYVYSKLSSSHGEFLRKLLETKFKTVYHFISINSKYLVALKKEKYLLVTNDKSISSDNNFVINDYPKQIDLINLEKKLSNFHYDKHTKTT